MFSARQLAPSGASSVTIESVKTASANRRKNLKNRTRARGAVQARCSRRASAASPCNRTELRRCTTKTASDWGYIDEPVLRTGSGDWRYFHRNQQYSVIALTNGGGTVTERYAYSAYGTPTITDGAGTTLTTSAENNRYTYTGREYDEALGLYHYRARMYDSVAGRFCSRDPIGFDGSRWSLYELSLSNPLRFVDPTGNVPIPIPEDTNWTCVGQCIALRLPTAGPYCKASCAACAAGVLPACAACVATCGLMASCVPECTTFKCIERERIVKNKKNLTLPLKSQGEGRVSKYGYMQRTCTYGFDPPLSDTGNWECPTYSGGDKTITITWDPRDPFAKRNCPEFNDSPCELVEYEWKECDCPSF